MSNNQDHKELVNKIAVWRTFWVDVVAPIAKESLQFYGNICPETADAKGLNYITSVIDIFHIEDLDEMCVLDLLPSEHNDYTNNYTISLTKL